MPERRAPGESEFLKTFREAFEEGNRAWNEGDFERAYGALPEDVEYELAAIWPQARPLRGRDEIIAFFKELREALPDIHSGPLGFIEAGERTVIVHFRVMGTGRSSGAGTEMEVWQVWEVDEGNVPLRVIEFSDRGAALKAAGAKERVEGKT